MMFVVNGVVPMCLAVVLAVVHSSGCVVFLPAVKRLRMPSRWPRKATVRVLTSSSKISTAAIISGSACPATLLPAGKRICQWKSFGQYFESLLDRIVTIKIIKLSV